MNPEFCRALKKGWLSQSFTSDTRLECTGRTGAGVSDPQVLLALPHLLLFAWFIWVLQEATVAGWKEHMEIPGLQALEFDTCALNQDKTFIYYFIKRHFFPPKQQASMGLLTAERWPPGALAGPPPPGAVAW